MRVPHFSRPLREVGPLLRRMASILALPPLASVTLCALRGKRLAEVRAILICFLGLSTRYLPLTAEITERIHLWPLPQSILPAVISSVS